MRKLLVPLVVVAGGLYAAASPAYAWYDGWGRWHPNYHHYYYHAPGYYHWHGRPWAYRYHHGYYPAYRPHPYY